MKTRTEEKKYWLIAIPSAIVSIVLNVGMIIRDSLAQPPLDSRYAVTTIFKMFGIIFMIAIALPALATGCYAGNRLGRKGIYPSNRIPRILTGADAYRLGTISGLLGVVLYWLGSIL